MSALRFGNLTPAPRGPNALRLAANFAAAVVRAGVHVARGGPFHVGAEVSARRLEVCRSCEAHVSQGDDERCMDPRCGCFVKSLLLNKVNWSSEACPRGKWPEVTT